MRYVLFFSLFMCSFFFFFFFNDTATTEIYTLSYTTLFRSVRRGGKLTIRVRGQPVGSVDVVRTDMVAPADRSEEHTSELQSHHDLVCRLLLEKKKNEERPVHDAMRTVKHVDPEKQSTIREC